MKQTKRRTKRVCNECGKSFYGDSDCRYCPDCAKEKKLDTVVRIRICQDCGVKFYGGPRAKRCSECAYEAKREARRRYRKQGIRRPVGSVDKCQWCGAEYTVVSGRQKYCSDKCMREAVRAWQRDQKKEYNREFSQEVNERKKERRTQRKKVCIYCGRIYWSEKPTNLCSEYCKHEHRKLSQCKYDIQRGYNRDIQKYLEAREKYREKIKAE